MVAFSVDALVSDWSSSCFSYPALSLMVVPGEQLGAEAVVPGEQLGAEAVVPGGSWGRRRWCLGAAGGGGGGGRLAPSSDMGIGLRRGLLPLKESGEGSFHAGYVRRECT